MYNDYYLQAINEKLASSNMSLGDIIENQVTVLNNQAILISGDKEISQKLDVLNTSVLTITCGVLMLALFLFIVRCFK